VDAIRTYYSGPGGGTRPASTQGNANSSDFVNINWTHTFNSHLVNQTGANVIRPYGANLTQAATEGIPYVNVNNLAGFGSWAPGNFSQTTYSWRDVMTATIKTHTLKFGADLFNTREVDHQGGAFTRPTFNYRNLIDLIQDEPWNQSGPAVNLQNHQQAPYDRIYRDLIEGYYLQDDWKVSPRLTVNLGVRYDTMVNFFSIYSPTLSRFNLGTGSTWNAKIASGTAYAGKHPQGSRPQYRGIHTARRLLLGCLWHGQDGDSRRLWHVRGPATVSAHHGLDLREPAQLLQPVDDVTAGGATPKPFICTPKGPGI
jgi:outer membrane receptor protein involved in Fe transport